MIARPTTMQTSHWCPVRCTVFPDTIHRGGEVFFCAGKTQVLAAIEAERAEQQSAPTKKAA